MNATETPLVIVASVALEGRIEEPGSEAALALQERDLAVPALLRIEAANVLRRWWPVAPRGVIRARIFCRSSNQRRS